MTQIKIDKIDKIWIKGLKKMSLEELQEICKMERIPRSDYAMYNRKELLSFYIENYKNGGIAKYNDGKLSKYDELLEDELFKLCQKRGLKEYKELDSTEEIIQLLLEYDEKKKKKQ
jgi:hypothetical protein